MGGVSLKGHRYWNCADDSGLLLSLTEILRKESLLSSSKWGGADELLLLSGGPRTDFSSYSMMMGPPKMRVIARQPETNFLPPRSDDCSPMKGEITLGPQPPALELQVQEWDEIEWKTTSHHFGINLGEALSTLDQLQTPRDSFEHIVNPGSWAGGLAYDLVQWTQPWQLFHPPDEGDILLILYRVDRWILHDRASSTLHLIVEDGDEWGNEVEDLLSILPNPINIPTRSPDTPIQPSVEVSSQSDEEHAKIVEEVKKSIKAGEFYQLNFGRRWMGKLQEEPWNTMLRLCKDNPAPMSTWLNSPDLDLAICSCSPELLMAVKDRQVSTRPIKGTRPRNQDIHLDEQLRNELILDKKENSEHRMLVDLERNDIGIVCQPGSVDASQFQVEAYSQVQHLVTEVQGTLQDEENVWSALNAIFPGGSITGCPKTATIAAIDELEKHNRSFWTGSIGYSDPRCGTAMWNILIRTMEAKQSIEGWKATIQAGGGLVMASNAEMEVEEAKWKAQALRVAAGWLSEERSTESVNCPHAIYPLKNIKRRPVKLNSEIGKIAYWEEDLIALESELRVLFIDNLDSFSWNIMHSLCELRADVVHCQGRGGASEQLTDILSKVNPTHILIGPGPGRPEASPLSMQIAKEALQGQLPPVLGICLGHQALGIAAGMKLRQCPSGALHGIPVAIHHQEDSVFSGFSSPMLMTRYNSLSLDQRESCLKIIATDENQEVMAIQHNNLPILGLQFHPESIGSTMGIDLISSFLSSPARREVEKQDSHRRD